MREYKIDLDYIQEPKNAARLKGLLEQAIMKQHQQIDEFNEGLIQRIPEKAEIIKQTKEFEELASKTKKANGDLRALQIINQSTKASLELQQK